MAEFVDLNTPSAFSIHTVPNDVFTEIQKEINSLQQDFSKGTLVNHILVGHIKKEFRLTQCHSTVRNWLDDVLVEHDKKSGYLKENGATEYTPPTLDNLWVNFQQKHEFNPPHKHHGIMSFVIWVEVPYTKEQEQKYFEDIKIGSGPLNGSFGFLYTNAHGDIQDHIIHVDKTWEKKMALFPSKMVHWVNPFYTSDNYRISVSGNIVLAPAH